MKEFIIASFLAGLSLIGAVFFPEIPEPIVVFFWITFGLFSLVAGFHIAVWVDEQRIRSIRDIEVAKVAGFRIRAEVVRDLSPAGIELVSRGEMTMRGIMGTTGVTWLLRASIPIPREFMLMYLRASHATYPYVYPIREVKRNDDLRMFTHCEELAAAFVDQMVMSGWCDPPNGNQAAKMLMPIEEAAARIEVDLDWYPPAEDDDEDVIPRSYAIDGE